MKVTFYSNYLNHHQIPFSNEMYSILGNEYTFVTTETISKERTDLGWKADLKYPYEIRTYESNESFNIALKLAVDSDVVIFGSAPEFYIEERMKFSNKLTFRYSERVYRKGLWRALSPRGLYYRYRTYFRHINKPLYMLCASAYTSGDLAILGSYLGRCYKWGYFPELRKYNLEDLMNNKKNEKVKILWAGRLINLKHPDYVIELAKKLKLNGYCYSLDIIGTGEKIMDLKKLVEKYEISDSVTFLGPMKPVQVREYMEKANIYVFTSDFNEGWGAVLNEAMNSGCAVVASHAIGSVPFLIRHGENGLIYKDGNIDDLYKWVKLLIDDKVLCELIGKEANDTISGTWNPKVAAERILELSDCLLRGDKRYFDNGPCSKAVNIPQREMYNRIVLPRKTMD